MSSGLPVLAALLACGTPDGGQNVHQRGVGDEPGGVELQIGDIAVAPTGDYLLFERDGRLAVGWPNDGLVRELPVDRPGRLAFSKKRPVVYVGSRMSSLVAVDVTHSRRLWQTELTANDFRIESSEDDRYVVLAFSRSLRVVAADTGLTTFSHEFERDVVDVDLLPDGERALVATEHFWSGVGENETPTTRVAVVELGSGEVRELDVPNCADQVAITPDGQRAFLAPTTCTDPFSIDIDIDIDFGFRGRGSNRGYDPVSLIDLDSGNESFVRNLPGFGPVAMAPDGVTAVAFADRDLIDRSLFDDPAEAERLERSSSRYHIMVLDAKRLTYDFAAVGEQLPRYAMTPNGEVLLVDSAFSENAVRLFDTAALSFRSVDGAVVQLENFVINGASNRAYGLDGGLFEIDIERAASRMLPSEFLPMNINISPDDRTLYLRRDAANVCVYSIELERCRTTMSLGPLMVK